MSVAVLENGDSFTFVDHIKTNPHHSSCQHTINDRFLQQTSGFGVNLKNPDSNPGSFAVCTL